MKFIIASHLLKTAVAFVSRAIKKNPIVPALENIHFSIEGEIMTLRASDMQNTLITTLPVESQSEGAFLLPSDKLSQLLAVLPEQPLTFTIDNESFAHTIKWESGKSKLGGENPADFPMPKEPKGTPVSVTLEGESKDRFIEALASTVYATSTDELRPAMTGVSLQADANGLVLVATNGFMLIECPVPIEGAKTLPPCIIEGVFVKSLLKAASELDEPITLKLTGAVIEATIGKSTIIGRLVDARFPDYKAIIPEHNPIEVQVGKGALMATLKRILITADTTKVVRLVLKKNALVLSSENPDYNNESDETIPVDYQDEGIEIGFNGERVLIILSHIPGDTVNIGMGTFNRAAIFWGGDRSIVTLLQPERITVHA